MHGHVRPQEGLWSVLRKEFPKFWDVVKKMPEKAATDPREHFVWKLFQADVRVVSLIKFETTVFVEFALRHENRYLVERWSNSETPPDNDFGAIALLLTETEGKRTHLRGETKFQDVLKEYKGMRGGMPLYDGKKRTSLIRSNARSLATNFKNNITEHAYSRVKNYLRRVVGWDWRKASEATSALFTTNERPVNTEDPHFNWDLFPPEKLEFPKLSSNWWKFIDFFQQLQGRMCGSISAEADKVQKKARKRAQDHGYDGEPKMHKRRRERGAKVGKWVREKRRRLEEEKAALEAKAETERQTGSSEAEQDVAAPPPQAIVPVYKVMPTMCLGLDHIDYDTTNYHEFLKRAFNPKTDIEKSVLPAMWTKLDLKERDKILALWEMAFVIPPKIRENFSGFITTNGVDVTFVCGREPRKGDDRPMTAPGEWKRKRTSEGDDTPTGRPPSRTPKRRKINDVGGKTNESPAVVESRFVGAGPKGSIDDYARTMGLDPGVRLMFAGTEVTGNKRDKKQVKRISVAGKNFRFRIGEHTRRMVREKQTWQVGRANAEMLRNRFPLLNTNNPNDARRVTEYRLANLQHCRDIYCRRSVARLGFRKYICENSHIDKMIEYWARPDDEEKAKKKKKKMTEGKKRRLERRAEERKKKQNNDDAMPEGNESRKEANNAVPEPTKKPKKRKKRKIRADGLRRMRVKAWRLLMELEAQEEAAAAAAAQSTSETEPPQSPAKTAKRPSSRSRVRRKLEEQFAVVDPARRRSPARPSSVMSAEAHDDTSNCSEGFQLLDQRPMDENLTTIVGDLESTFTIAEKVNRLFAVAASNWQPIEVENNNDDDKDHDPDFQPRKHTPRSSAYRMHKLSKTSVSSKGSGGGTTTPSPSPSRVLAAASEPKPKPSSSGSSCKRNQGRKSAVSTKGNRSESSTPDKTPISRTRCGNEGVFALKRPKSVSLTPSSRDAESSEPKKRRISEMDCQDSYVASASTTPRSTPAAAATPSTTRTSAASTRMSPPKSSGGSRGSTRSRTTTGPTTVEGTTLSSEARKRLRALIAEGDTKMPGFVHKWRRGSRKKVDRKLTDRALYAQKDIGLVSVDEYLTSQLCSECNRRMDVSKGRDRYAHCPRCRITWNRDHNAANNIRQLGLYREGMVPEKYMLHPENFLRGSKEECRRWKTTTETKGKQPDVCVTSTRGKKRREPTKKPDLAKLDKKALPRSSSSSWSDRRVAASLGFVIGMTNGDNVSCYANATLQCLFRCTEILRGLIGSNNGPDAALKSLARLYDRARNDPNADPLDSMPVREFVGGVFVDHRQQDAAEFLGGIYDKSDLVVQAIEHNLRITVRCETNGCSVLCSNVQRNRILMVHLGSSNAANLQELVNAAACQCTDIKGDGCVRCKGKMIHVTTVESVKRYLVLQLVIFRDDGYGQIDKLRGFRVNGVTGETITLKGDRFRVIGAIFHHGDTADTGHYTVQLKKAGNDDGWLNVDDTRVSEGDWAQVKDADPYLIVLEKMT